jgi:hypothetical protein
LAGRYAFINATGKGIADPEALAAEIQKAARSSCRLPKTVENSVNQVLAVSAMSIQSYLQQLKALDKGFVLRFLVLTTAKK